MLRISNVIAELNVEKCVKRFGSVLRQFIPQSYAPHGIWHRFSRSFQVLSTK